MTKGSLIRVCLLSALLTACADEDAQNPPPVPPPTTYVTTNNVYNGTIIYETTGEARPTPPTRSFPVPEPSALPPRNISTGGAPRDLVTTGVPECDAYLVRVESCTRGMLSGPGQSAALDRITASLDTARRAWRKAAANPASRELLVGSCADSLTQYNAEVVNVVCE